MNMIKRIVESRRLILAWQPQREIDKTRTRRAVGEILRLDNGQFSFNYLVNTDDYNIARKVGLEHYNPFLEEKSYTGSFVLDSFSNRLPPRSRRDFVKYLEFLCIPPDATLSDFSLLGYSGGYLPSDNFSIVNTFDGIAGDCQFLIDVAGFRYYRELLGQIGLGVEVEICLEPNNEWDKKAIMFKIKGKKVGNVNRLMLPAFHRWLKNKNVRAVVKWIEGSYEKPRLFVFVSISR